MHKEELESRYMYNRRLRDIETLIISKICKGEYVSDMIDYRTKVLDKLRIR